VALQAEALPDLNGDGIEEHLVCWSDYADPETRRPRRQGRLEIRSGHGGELLQEIFGDERSFWRTVSWMDDLDGDGLPEVCANGAHPSALTGQVELLSLKSGERLVSLTGPRRLGFGLAAALAGDLDGDGAPELLVGSPTAFERGLASGACYAYSLRDPATGSWLEEPLLVQRFAGKKHQEQFGHLILPLGDIDADGTPDFCATGWYASAGSFHNGIVRAVSGADGRELWLATGNSPLADFGRSAALLPDVDGDGHAEVVAGARRSSRAAPFGGSFSVLSGRNGRTLLEIDGTGAWDGLGSGVASAGDFNGDGHPDVLVSEHFPGDGQDAGARPEREIRERVFVYSVVPLE
jgi:hypothetical protein